MASTWCAPVLLGRCDSSCPTLKLSPYENKVGGYPDFFLPSVLHSPPCCQLCKSPLLLLVQVYCPLEASPYHRLMHVFCCPRPPCWNQSESWLVLRSQWKDPSYSISQVDEETNTVCSAAVTDWCEEAEDWGSDTDEQKREPEAPTTSANESWTVPVSSSPANTTGRVPDSGIVSTITERMEDLCLDVAPPSPYNGPYFPSSYVTVLEEPSEPKYTRKVEELLERYYRENPNFEPTSDLELKGSGSSEKYERSVAMHGDRAFQKFHKQLSKCPDQILRYSWKGSPLLITEGPVPEETLQCKFCGSPCVFEFQLMPQLVYLLQKSVQERTDHSVKLNPSAKISRLENHHTGRESGLVLPPPAPPVEFGTVLVYSCCKSCWEDVGGAVFRVECVFVQAEPDDCVQMFV